MNPLPSPPPRPGSGAGDRTASTAAPAGPRHDTHDRAGARAGLAARRIAIVQSSYIPWKGYFDLVRRVDEFVLFDDVQFTKRDWRSRNRIKTGQGPMWLTIPVKVRGRYQQPINETEVSDLGWNERHWRTLRTQYARAPHFARYRDALESLYAGCDSPLLSQINYRLTVGLCGLLGITTPLSWSMDYGGRGNKTERLVEICARAGATEYVSGPLAKSYIEPDQFREAGITLTFFDYAGYPEYPQLYPPFDHFVSVIDLIVHTGPEALRYLERQQP